MMNKTKKNSTRAKSHKGQAWDTGSKQGHKAKSKIEPGELQNPNMYMSDGRPTGKNEKGDYPAPVFPKGVTLTPVSFHGRVIPSPAHALSIISKWEQENRLTVRGGNKLAVVLVEGKGKGQKIRTASISGVILALCGLPPDHMTQTRKVWEAGGDGTWKKAGRYNTIAGAVALLKAGYMVVGEPAANMPGQFADMIRQHTELFRANKVIA